MPMIPSFLSRLNQAFNPPMGSDMPSQGGISGMMNQPDYGLPTQPDFVSQNMNPMVDDSGQDMSGVRPMGGNPTPGGINVNDIYNNLYTPQHTAEDAYNAMLQQYPQHEPASFMRKLAATFVGLGDGPKGAQEVLDEPFNEKLADWKNQMDKMGTSATLERYGNTNERQLASQETSRQIQAADEKRKELKDAEDAKIKEFRARAYDFKARNPDWKLVKQTDAKGHGTYWFVNPTNPNDKVNTNLEDGMVNDYDLQVLKNTAAQTRTETAVVGQKAVAAEKSWDIFTDPKSGKTYRISKEPGAKAEQIMLPGDTPDAAPIPAGPLDKPGVAKKSGTGSTGDTPTQQKIAEYNAAQDIYNRHPEWQKWIHLASRGPNTYTIDPLAGGTNILGMAFGAPDDNESQAYKDMQAEFAKRGIVIQNSKRTPTIGGATPDANTAPTAKSSKGDIDLSPGNTSASAAAMSRGNPTGAPGPNATVKDALDYKAKRLRAIQILQAGKRQVTEDTIATVMQRLP